MLDPSKLSVEQKLILSSQGNILVSASAGSGKTTMMIEKIMTLLYNGADLRRILVMTFTNDAASEMKARLIENIYKELRSNSVDATILKKQLEYLPFANIGTMDSFWKILYQKYFAVIGKDPSCNIVEPNEGNLLLNQTILKVLQKHIENNDEEFFKLAEVLNTGRSLDKFCQTLINVRKFMNAQEDEDDFINAAKRANIMDKNSPMVSYVWENLRKQFKIAMVETQKFIEKFAEVQAQILIDENTIFLESTSKLINSPDFDEFCKILKFIEAPEKIGSRIKKCPFIKEYGDFVDSIRELVIYATKFSEAYLEKGKEGEESNKLLELLSETEKEYSQVKEHKNLLDFNDLSKFAVKILKDENTRNEVKDSFDYIFVDEYQDTNYRQESLLEAISNGNNIFVVGDVKQAIYHFRNAEPAIFIDRKNRYDNAKTGSNILLNTNYRSDKSILKFVDDVCGELMTSNFGGVDYKHTANFVGGAEYIKVDDIPPVTVAILAKQKAIKDKKENSIYKINEGEFVSEDIEPDYDYVAQKIKELVGSHKIYNSKTAETTTIDYSDIVVLIRVWTQGYSIGEALDMYNIPFNILNNEKKESIERDLLVDYLSILFNPTKDTKLTNVLLSEIFNFSASELLEIRVGNTKVPLWESIIAYKGNQNIEDKVNNFVTKLDKLRFMSSYATVRELLESILQDGYDAILLNRGEKVIGEVNAFIQFIGNSEINGLEDFLEFYEQSYKGNVSPKLNNAVTITTIFKSKGLEYPIVFVPCLSDNLNNNNNDSLIYSDNEFGVAIKSIFPESYSIKENFAVMAHKLKQDYLEREEKIRVLYVALTRAKNHLFLSGMEGKLVPFLEKASSIMDYLEYAKARNPAIGIYFTNIEALNIPSSSKEGTINTPIELDAIKQDYLYQNATKTYAKMSVSQVLSEQHEGEISPYANKKGISADIGIAYHTVLQHLSYKEKSIEEVVEIIYTLVKEGALSTDEASKVDPNIVFGVLNWQIIQNNINNNFYREQSFMLYVKLEGNDDKTLVQGIVDLFIVNENIKEAIVVDFKVTNASNDALVVRYKKQLELYASAVEKLLGVKVKEKYIYSLLRGCAICI